MNRFLSALTLWLALIAEGWAAGTIPIALQQQQTINGIPMVAAQLFTYVQGTVATPQTTFQDSGLTLPNPWPLVTDQNGRIPMFYMADGSTHVRLTDSAGLVQFDYANMLVIGPSSGGGGGGTVDPTSIMATGDEKIRYGTGLISGWVRENGLTIGSAVSGATERANADTQALFIYLYNTDANLVVSGGRTGNALNDFNANKTIATPDMRGRLSAALDDMGNSPAGRLTSTYFGASGVCSGGLGTTLGVACGGESQTLTTAQIPSHTHPITDQQHQHSANITNTGGGSAFGPGGGGGLGLGTTNFAFTGITGTNAAGGGGAHPTIQPTMLKTFYIKL